MDPWRAHFKYSITDDDVYEWLKNDIEDSGKIIARHDGSIHVLDKNCPYCTTIFCGKNLKASTYHDRGSFEQGLWMHAQRCGKSSTQIQEAKSQLPPGMNHMCESCGKCFASSDALSQHAHDTGPVCIDKLDWAGQEWVWSQLDDAGKQAYYRLKGKKWAKQTSSSSG